MTPLALPLFPDLEADPPTPTPRTDQPSRAASEPPLPQPDPPHPAPNLEPPATEEPKPYLHHPETGEPLYLPENYLEDHGRLLLRKSNGDVVTVYRGAIYVLASGRNVANGERFLEVRFERRGGAHTVTVPRRALATSGGLIKQLSPLGAYVYAGNASHLVRFLSDFEAANTAALPERLVSDRLGVMPGGLLVTPSTCIGAPVHYVGDPQSHMTAGPDTQAYERLLRQMATWEGGHVLWWLLGLALASPFLRRLKPRRYPVVYLSGGSGAGKTTAGYFAMGVWVSPGEEPFMAQGIRTTQVAFIRTLERLGGLPFLIDEAHASQKPRELENTVYTFANGQSYGRANGDGGVAGGAALGGAVLLIGEARPEFEHAGSHNRLLLVNADLHPPMGTGAGRATALGMQRAQLLEQAWEQGAGHLGPRVAHKVLADWEQFKVQVETLRRAPAMLGLKDWAHAGAVVQATLEVLFGQVLGIPQPRAVLELPERLYDMLQVHRREANPAEEAFETLRTLVVQGEQRAAASGATLALGGEFIGWRNETHWHLLTSSRAFQHRLGRQAVQLHGRRWVEQGWVVPDPSQGSSTQSVYCAPKRGTARALVIPRRVLEGGASEV